ncbi:hypothetical protein LJR225_004065 [Phenylobacterium sp. LjRoot225]|uniref:hypothetical protein n=1 Tax=Phenylobacterium sp. LjRoot225 TaxID=3342285 RepID=UPI003ECCB57D
MTSDATLPLEHFIQAVQSQLDNAQTAMAVKARNLNLPLTFAIKDITLDLRAHVEFANSQIRLRPAGPSEKEASLFHLVFTAITRPMIDENAVSFSENPDDQSIDDLKDDLSDDERRRLEWVGVRTVSKLREVESQGESRTVGRVTSLPVDRLRRALERASSPLVEHVTPVGASPGDPPDLPALLRVRGRNLTQEGVSPYVAIGGRPVAVLKASDRELLIAPDAEQWAGELSIQPSPQLATTMGFDLRPFAPRPNGHGQPEAPS